MTISMMTIYNNVIAMFRYRNVRLISARIDDEDELIKTLNRSNHVIIVGEKDDLDGTKVSVRAIVLANDSKTSVKSTDIASMIKRIEEVKAVCEVIFVSLNGVNSVSKMIDKGTLNPASPIRFLEDLTYSTFVIEIPKHVLIPKHRLMQKDEVKAIAKNAKIMRENMQIIRSTDPMAIWIGARSGDVVEIERLSELAMTAIAYRRCV